MCEDSRSERQYWMHRVEQLRKQMEEEDLKRQRAQAALPKHPEPEQPRSRLGWMAGVTRDWKAWATGSRG